MRKLILLKKLKDINKQLQHLCPKVITATPIGIINELIQTIDFGDEIEERSLHEVGWRLHRFLKEAAMCDDIDMWLKFNDFVEELSSMKDKIYENTSICLTIKDLEIQRRNIMSELEI